MNLRDKFCHVPKFGTAWSSSPKNLITVMLGLERAVDGDAEVIGLFVGELR